VTKESNSPVSVNYFLEPGYIYVSPKPVVISTVLGSCIAVCLFDRKRNVGGMNHFQFPGTRDQDRATARYGNVALPLLIRMVLDGGSKKKHLEAQIFGGAHNREISPKDIGRGNITIARKILAREGIRIVSEDVGGEKGRKIVFDTQANEIAVLKVDKLRKGDWYPYKEVR
jgi:chemotaxis protein CheD